MEHLVVKALWEGYLLLRASQVVNAAAVTMDPTRGPRSRPLGWLATGIAGGATVWEWRRRRGRDLTVNDPATAIEVIGTSLALLALSPAIVRDADRGRGDDWFGLWGWWGQSAIALAMPHRPEPAMLAHLLPQVDAFTYRRPWLPHETASRNMLNAVGVAAGSRWAVSAVAKVGAEADRASARLVEEQARVVTDQTRREVQERHLQRTVDSLREIREHLTAGRVDTALTQSAATYEPLRAWLAGSEDTGAASLTSAARGHIDQMTRLVNRTERGLSVGDIAVAATAALNTVSVTVSRFNRQRRRGWVVAGLTSTVIYTASVAWGRFGLRQRPGASKEPPAALDRTLSPWSDTLFAILLVAFECASSDRHVASTWSAGQTQVHVALAATRIPDRAHLVTTWSLMGAAMFLADRYYAPEARTHRFRWQADWVNGMVAGLALRRSHTAIWAALDKLERSANYTIEAVAKQVAEAELAAAQDAVHDTACQSLRYLLTHPDDAPERLAGIIGATISSLETELSGAEADESEALTDALGACAAGYELLGLAARVSVHGDRPVGGEAVEVLVQVANQGLSNALAHSSDPTPEISLVLDEDGALLTVANQATNPYRGPSMDEAAVALGTDEQPEDHPSGGFGLASARRAVDALGGSLEWGDHPTLTQLVLRLPLSADGSPASTPRW